MTSAVRNGGTGGPAGPHPHALPGLLDTASWAEQEEGKSGQRRVRPARPTGRGPFLLTNASTSGSRCGGVSGSLEKERKGFMPQLPLSLRSAFFCQPISGNEGQGQQHYQVTVAQNGIFQTLGLDPPPHVLPGSLLSHTPQILLVTMSVWSAYLPNIF